MHRVRVLITTVHPLKSIPYLFIFSLFFSLYFTKTKPKAPKNRFQGLI